jgi:hypothetical protein
LAECNSAKRFDYFGEKAALGAEALKFVIAADDKNVVRGNRFQEEDNGDALERELTAVDEIAQEDRAALFGWSKSDENAREIGDLPMDIANDNAGGGYV